MPSTVTRQTSRGASSSGVTDALASLLAIARRLHAAGNIPDLALAREQAGAEEAKVQLRVAETTAQASREQLNILMGLWGKETAWHVERRLPAMPAESLPIEGLEVRALRAVLTWQAPGSR